ncbi:MAG: protein kinase domain-containing protein [Archangium sp.]
MGAAGGVIQDELRPGVVVNGFRLTRLVGEGAMGTVFQAVDERLGRRLALKFIRGAMLSERGLQRFQDEARTTARFSHPHIVTVYAAGVFAGRPYLALEYLDGPTLRERIDHQPLTVPEALRACRAIAEALAEAHRHGVVHADLKPENVIVPRDGRLRVVDFGLARLMGTDHVAASGTPAYMAPERWLGSAPSPAMDVWALGVLLHELIEGKRPWADHELAQLAYSDTAVKLGAKVSASPSAALIAACLAIEPAERPSAAELVARLERSLSGAHGDETRSPFRGLEAFSEKDAIDFHGRAAEIDAALERLRTSALLPVIGPSGVGKSSFVFAGLLPRLRERGAWDVRSLRPGRRPWVSLATALQCDAEALAKSPGALITALRALASQRQVLLVIDQFEELVTLGDVETRTAVLRALAAAASPEEPWRLVFTLRSDFLPEFAASPELAPGLEALFVLRPLTRTALVEAIEAPLRRVNYTCDEPSLPTRIAAELDGQTNALPLLQFACQALWERREVASRQVLQREYDAIGGAVGALATHAQRVVQELLPEERKLVRSLMLRLVNADGTRRPRTRSEVLSGLPTEASGALDRLLRERLLVADQHEDTGEPMIELAHESLVSAWPQLARWLSDSQDARALVHEVEQAAVLWERRGRRGDETWKEDALADTVRRIQNANVSLTGVASSFLEAGRARQSQLKRTRRAIIGGAFAAVSLAAIGLGIAAVAFREKEREAVAQAEQIRLAAGDMGRFELILEPFDWDSERRVAVPVNAAELPSLDWVLLSASKDAEQHGGAPVPDVALRRGTRQIEADGSIHEIIETRSSPVVFRFDGRGRAGERCAPSWYSIESLPGFAERDSARTVRIAVPTCRATRAGTVAIPSGPFFRGYNGENIETEQPAYAIDRTEFPVELAELYFRDARAGEPPRKPPTVLGGAVPGIPATWVTALDAQRYCSFMGRRLPTANEWQKAARGGIWLDEARTVLNADPKRATPWGDASTEGANVDLEKPKLPLTTSGSSPRDVSPYGVRDMGGNVSEWTATLSPEEAYPGLRVYLGRSSLQPRDAIWGLESIMVMDPSVRLFNVGFRCASE